MEYKTSHEFQFLKALRNELAHMPNLTIDAELRGNNKYIDLSVTDKISGKRVLIETKNVDNYNQLPLATVSELYTVKNNNPNDKVMLISFSNISENIKSKLDEIDVNYLASPNINQTIDAIQKELNIQI